MKQKITKFFNFNFNKTNKQTTKAVPAEVSNPIPDPKDSVSYQKQTISLAYKIIELCTLLETKEGYPQIYKLPQTITNTYPIICTNL